MLAIDGDGNLHIIELKKNRAPRKKGHLNIRWGKVNEHHNGKINNTKICI